MPAGMTGIPPMEVVQSSRSILEDTLTNDLTSIIASLEQQRTAIDRALEALRGLGGQIGTQPATKRRGRPPGSGRKRVLSPEGRQRIIEATKRRWAAVRNAEKQQAPKKRGGMSAAARKRLSELMKARWASKNPPKPVGRKEARV